MEGNVRVFYWDKPIMSLIKFSMEHGGTLEDARGRLEPAVGQMRGLFGPLVRQVAWSTDRSQVRIDGAGFWLEMSVDEKHVHASGDIPALAGLLGGPLDTGIKRIVQSSFQKKLAK
jgi:hypothetical protein